MQSATFSRVDQGVDQTGDGPLRAARLRKRGRRPSTLSQRILLIDDGVESTDLLESHFSRHAIKLMRVACGKDASAIGKTFEPDCILLSEDLTDESSVDAYETAAEAYEGVPVIIVTHRATIDSAITFTRMGAADYIELPGSLDRLETILADLEAGEGAAARGGVAGKVPASPKKHLLVGTSEATEEVRQVLELVGRSSCDVILIQGETGTGKELAARTIHDVSKRWNGNFVDVNCAALSSSLLESELFGHEKGAFTGADRAKRGLFELANGGTLFLDEIGEMDADLQAKLLRVLEERTFRRVGGMERIEVDVRVVATTNRNLAREVEEGGFRRDLYYRLNVFTVELPALRERLDDIAPLAEHFLAKSAERAGKTFDGFTSEAMEALARHTWPGNVRELRNVIERAVIVGGEGEIEAAHLGLPTPAEAPPALTRTGPEIADFSLRTAERELILRVLKETGWQKTKSASLLGITRATLYSKISQYGLDERELGKA